MATPAAAAPATPGSSNRPFIVYRSDGNAPADAAGGANGAVFHDDLTAFETANLGPGNVRANPSGLNNVRNHLFHVMLVKLALSYAQHTTARVRRVIEFLFLAVALCCLGGLVYVHVLIPAIPTNCLESIRDTWPKLGIIRVEVVKSWDEYHVYQETLKRRKSNFTPFSLREILIQGPEALPSELKQIHNFKTNFKAVIDKAKANNASSHIFQLFTTIYDMIPDMLIDKSWSETRSTGIGDFSFSEHINPDEFDLFDVETLAPAPFLYIVEYSAYHGLLRMPAFLRTHYKIPTMLVQLSSDDPNQCLYNYRRNGFTKFLTGYDDILMNSLKSLSDNEKEKGYLHDLIRDEHYHFVSFAQSRLVYLTAMCVMFIFTFAISMLLRFSHHQIFLFIVDLLHMFELNQPLVFPVAPLLTVILALVGMEAIMSEIFSDTTTAFYIILIVWIADQYDAICCQSQIGRRYWLRFFYLYHFGFYAYHYRYNGLHTGGALVTSSAFIVHSMVYFFHHYELPIILYHDEVRRVVRRINQQNAEVLHEPNVHPTATTDASDTHSAVYIPSETPAIQRDRIIHQATTHGMTIIGPGAPSVVVSDVGDGTEQVVAERAAEEVVQQVLGEVFADVAVAESAEPTSSSSS
uniref:Membralin n=1 Tax=Panagrellus redivivus TaxID=6233 RepID=A0A7E4V4D9_PANRE